MLLCQLPNNIPVPSPMDTQFFGKLRIYLEFQRMQTIACSALLPAGEKESILQCKYHSITIDAESLGPEIILELLKFGSSVQEDLLNRTWSFLFEDAPPE